MTGHLITLKVKVQENKLRLRCYAYETALQCTFLAQMILREKNASKISKEGTSTITKIIDDPEKSQQKYL